MQSFLVLTPAGRQVAEALVRWLAYLTVRCTVNGQVSARRVAAMLRSKRRARRQYGLPQLPVTSVEFDALSALNLRVADDGVDLVPLQRHRH